ncbi:MAG: DUF6538 domain-containing protein [Lysobacteraceae bacterium]|jgi:hypothetical protein|nr:hypothetical protein [Silanimonas sp.]
MKGRTKSTHTVFRKANTQHLWVRIYVPKHLHPRYGTERRFSLGISDMSEAKKRAVQHAAEWYRLFEAETCEGADPFEKIERSANLIRQGIASGSVAPEVADDFFEAEVDAALDELARTYGRDPESGHPLLPEAEED